MQLQCSTRGPTVALVPLHSKRSRLLSTEEPETSSIIAPSAKISPAVMRQRFVAFDPLFALGFALVFKAISSLRSGCAKRTTVWRPRKIRYFPEPETQSPFHTDPAFKRPLQSVCRFPNKWQRPDRLAEPRRA